ncbi:MAG: hypothetical protein IJ693_11840 [Bacteroidaceae bacterium]|nr:hypothetical protein [Bacteroidaceae bacterium]
MSKELNSDLQGWHTNTDLGVDVKTILSSDRRMKTGKGYQGTLCRDSDGVVDEFLCRDAHYTFVETLPAGDGKRNPRVFEGRYITITRGDDGSLRPNFKRMEVGSGFTVDGYAIGVMGELRRALTGLVEKKY